MQVERLFSIVYYLLEKKSATANELAERLAVSKRTILRDVDTLSVAGIPVCTTAGRGGGISISDRFVLDKTHLSEDEQKKILFALQSVAATHNTDFDEALGKLSSFFGKSDTDWIEIDFSRWGNALSDRKKFDTVKTAILSGRVLTFIYVGSDGNTSARKACPLKFVLKSNAWYVQAYCLQRNDYRTFKLNRMLRVRITEETFDTAAYKAPPLRDDTTASPQAVRLKLCFSPRAAYRVYDEFCPDCIVKTADGSLTVETEWPHDSWICGYLLTFGADVRVLEPSYIRDELLAQVGKIKEIYNR